MINLKDPQYYLNRELSWLEFNTRVLDQAKNTALPLLERLKFLAIYGTNLDEFYMIRVAGLKKLFRAGIIVSGADRLTPLQQLREIREYLHQELLTLEESFDEIFAGLQAEGVVLKTYAEACETNKQVLDNYFFDHIYPVIVPIAVDSTHPFPHLNNLSFGLVVKLQEIDDPAHQRYGLVRIPRVLPRFIEVASGIYVTIESVVAEHIGDLFPGHTLLQHTPFRVTRNADIQIEEEEADDFMEILEEGLKLRKKGELVRLEIGVDVDEELLGFLNRHTNIDPEDIYRYRAVLNLGSLWQIVGNRDFAHLVADLHTPRTLPPLNNNESIYTALEKQDVLLYHPYESFEPVVKLIQTAAKDPDVLSIRMTLYRSGSNSPIVNALMQAAESGKQVTAMVELKARFDEENNVIWAKALESAGAHVIYGIPGLKVHAKAALITRRVGDSLKQYAHLGTGNYNPSTAKIYTDTSFMTTDEAITGDMTRFFHFLTGFSRHGMLNRLYMSPKQIKPRVLELIKGETEKGSEGHIIAKINSLVDDDVIRALYKASQKGVKVELIVRGICCLLPGVEGISDNIRVISIIGKYLEHARIFYFKHGTPQVYISSADWMPRNLVRRIELLTGIEDEESAARLIRILQLQLSDNVLAYELQSDGSYLKVTEGSEAVNSQEVMEQHTDKMYKAVKKESTDEIQKLATKLFKES